MFRSSLRFIHQLIASKMDLPNACHQQLRLPASDYPLTQQSPPNHAVNGHLVYVRRKSEGDTPKHTAFENSRQLYCEQEDINDPKVSITSSAKPSTPVAPSSGHTVATPKVFTNVHWEQRYQQLQLFLSKLDQSSQADYIQLLQSLSSIELSRHAVELEKRSIQLSLEEAKELQRVAALNVLGKPVKNFKAPADHGTST